MKRLSFAVPLALTGALFVSGAYPTYEALQGAAEIENRIRQTQPLIEGDITNEPLFEELQDDLDAVRTVVRAAKEATRPQPGKGRAKAAAIKNFEEIRTLSQRGPVEPERILDALTTIAQAGGFELAGIHPQDFAACTTRGLREQIALDFAKVLDLKAKGRWNTREIARLREEIELIGGYEAAGLKPQDLRAAHNKGMMEGLELAKAKLDRTLTATQNTAIVYGSELWGRFKACAAFVTGGKEGYASSYREHYRLAARDALLALGKQKGRAYRDPTVLNAFITAAGGLDATDLTLAEYRTATGRDYPIATAKGAAPKNDPRPNG